MRSFWNSLGTSYRLWNMFRVPTTVPHPCFFMLSDMFVSCAFMSPSITNSKEPKPQQHHSNTAMYTSWCDRLKRCFWHTHIKPSTKRIVLDPGDLVWCSSRHLTSSFGELSIYRVDFWPCCIGAGGVKKHASWMMSVCIIDETINDGSILSQSF